MKRSRFSEEWIRRKYGMNLSRRSRLSLCQFLDLFNREALVVLLEK